MKNKDNMQAIEDLALSEGGVFTTAQASRLGIPRDALSYAARASHIERVAHGAYRLASAADDGLDELRAIWKLTTPERFSHERAGGEGWDGIAVCGPTAAFVLGVGDFYASPYYFATPRRINSRRGDVRFVRMDVAREDVAWRAGMPVMCAGAAIASLVRLREDPSLVADAFVDAVRRYGSTSLDVLRLEGLLGSEAYEQVLRDAGIGEEGPRRLVRLDGLGHVAIAEGTVA